MDAMLTLLKASSSHETADAFNSLIIGGGIAVLLVFVIAIAFLSVLYQLMKSNKDNINRQKEFTDSFLIMEKEAKANFVAVYQASLSKLMAMLEEIKRVSGIPHLSKDSLYEIFKYVSKVHVQEKGRYVEHILLENDIHNRREQIKKNIEIKFKDITQKECNTLSMFNTIYGDIGKLFCKWVDWDVFLPVVFKIVFSDNEITQKLNDLHALMDGYLSDFWEQLTK